MKKKIIEFIVIITLAIINLLIAYAITIPLGLKDVVLFNSMTAMNWTITYEIIIWFSLSLIEAIIYEKGIKKSKV